MADAQGEEDGALDFGEMGWQECADVLEKAGAIEHSDLVAKKHRGTSEAPASLGDEHRTGKISASEIGGERDRDDRD